MTTVYVGNLPASAQADTLEKIFGRYGKVLRVSLHPDEERRRRRYYGYVEMAGSEEAQRASRLLNGCPLAGHFITVVPVALEAETGQSRH